MDIESIREAIAQYQDPWMGCDLITAKAVKKIEILDEIPSIEIVLGYPGVSQREAILATLAKLIQTISDIHQVNIKLDWKIEPHAVQPPLRGLDNVKNIIAIASGKGGVGKSTTAVNLALALHAEGARTGILDADIYGPNQPQMLGIHDHQEITEQKKIVPLENHGLQSMSIGYLVDTHQPMIWRGPMVSKALEQLLNDTLWNDLDYLVVDLPPGTGDIQLTLAKKVPVSAAVVVTTPQEVALLDARKAYEMFKKVNVPVLGLIENMSLHTCSQCGHQEPIFGEGGGMRLAKEIDIELLGQLPLDMSIRDNADRGNPSVIANPRGNIAKLYRDIALRLAAKLALRPKNLALKFPKIVVEKS